MKIMKRVILMIPLFTFFLNLSAQEKMVTGTVSSDNTSEAVANATIQNRTNKKNTTSNSGGHFSIKASKGDVLEISSVGYLKKSTTVGDGAEINVSLAVNERQLSEVVVTAMGITKDKRGLGYSVQDIKGDEIAETQRENFFNAIQGRVAGASVTSTSGAPGASSQVVLRGFNSLSGNNSPLIIVDGLPMNNDVFNQHRLASDLDNRNNDFTNRAADINPEDIESISILKGPEAAALYGTEAGSGAIVITTKKGKQQSLKVGYENNFRFEQITKFHDVQQKYDLGTNGLTSLQVRGFFGPIYPDNTVLYNNLENFFLAGQSHKQTLTAEAGNKMFSYRWSGTYSDRNGVIPNTQERKINSRITVSAKLRDNLTVTAIGSYANSFNKKAFRGAGGYMLGLLYWPLDDDASNYIKEDGNRRIVTKLSSGADNMGEQNNPYFEVNKNLNFDNLNRNTINLQVSYDPLNWLNLSARGSGDNYKQEGGYMWHPQSFNVYTIGGRIEQYQQKFAGYSGTFIATAKKQLGPIAATFRLGSAIDDRRTDIYSRRGDSIVNVNSITHDNMTVEDFTSLTPNKRITSKTSGRDTLILERSLGVFGELNLDYNSFLYLNFTGRHDWLAEFPATNRKFFYPSASLSFIFSELLGENNLLTLGKFRASVAQTGKRVAPYSNQSVYSPLFSATNTYGVAYGFTNNNPNLKPERQTTVETGLEMKLFNNRVGVDFTYYNTFVYQQVVVNMRASYATGFILNTLNAASIRNQGVEAMLNIHAIKQKNFNWRVTLNGSRMWNKVTDLPATLPEFYNSDSWLAGYRASLFYGLPTTTISGQTYMKNTAGKILIDPLTGYPIADPNYIRIGDRNPDFVLGITNRFNYKSLSFSFLMDVKIGGDVLNGTEQWLVQNGLSKRTLDREKPRIIPGVLNDGLQNSATPTPNTIQITPYFQNDYYTGRTYAVDFIEHDVNWLRLRDVTLSYNFSKSFLNSLRILQSGVFFVTGTDLFILTNYTGVDPAVNGNTPATGGVGSFAIDFGNTATPIGINFGLKATFKQKK